MKHHPLSSLGVRGIERVADDGMTPCARVDADLMSNACDDLDHTQRLVIAMCEWDKPRVGLLDMSFVFLRRVEECDHLGGL